MQLSLVKHHTLFKTCSCNIALILCHIGVNFHGIQIFVDFVDSSIPQNYIHCAEVIRLCHESVDP